jgi:trimeric autotransporter adhesin
MNEGGVVRGMVRAGDGKDALGLPGVSITATNTLTGEKYTTVTDASGAYGMAIPKNGRYVVRAELAAFAAGTKEVVLNATTRQVQVDLSMVLASRAESGQDTIAGASALGMTRGTQALAVMGANQGAQSAGLGGGNNGASLPQVSGGDSGDAVAIAGSSGATAPGFNFEAAREQIEDQRALQGTTETRSVDRYSDARGFLGGGPPPGGGGASAFRRFNPNAVHGSFVYQATNSALNAQNFSVTGTPEPKPSYGTSRYGLVYAGPPIPKLLNSTKDFVFIAAFGNHGSTAFDQSGNVPTDAERMGTIATPINAQTGQPIPLVNPFTGVPYATNSGTGQPLTQTIIGCGAGCGINPITQALLAYIPQPNQANATAGQPNYRLLTSQGTNSDQVSARYVHNFGAGGGGGMPGGMRISGAGGSGSKTLSQNLNANFNFQHTSEDEVTLYPDFGGKDQLYQYVLNLGYSLAKGTWTNNISFIANRTDSESRNYFTDVNNVAGNLGIEGVGSLPFFYGLPSLQFSQFSPGQEQQPSSRIQMTGQIADNASWIHKKHNIRYGGDFRKIFLNVIGGVQGTGAFTFSGFATGSDFADFLIGLPQAATLQGPCPAGSPTSLCQPSNGKFYLRANVFEGYAQDTWRVSPTVTLLYGIRYEYYGPYYEKQNRLANLDPNATFTDVDRVTPASNQGTFGGAYPRSLVEPFRGGWAPRLGIAWKAAKNTVVRTGYGINYNTSQYGDFIQKLAYQNPFAIANNNTQTLSPANPAPDLFTLQNGLTTEQSVCPSGSLPPTCLTNNYAVDKNYRMGYVQVWNIDVQQTLGKGFVMNVGYNGSKGTHLDGLLAPNRILNFGPTTANAQVFDYEVSQAQSNFNALAVRLRKRLQHGLAIGATYTYSHSIDDASSIGGSSAVVAQRPLDLIGDMGNSAFDQRHLLKGDYTWELPFGPNGKYLNGGNWLSHAMSGLQFYGNFTFATGLPLNPYYAAAAAEVSGGVTNSLRPDRVPGSSLEGGPSQLKEWFNTAAFSLPVDGTTGLLHYGSAGRNSIPGPGTREIDMAFSKYVSFGGTKSIEFRATANNVFNLVQYSSVSTAIGNPTAGAVTSASAMRNFLMLARYRF